MTYDVRSPVLVITDHLHHHCSAVERLAQSRITDDNDERSVVQLRSAHQQPATRDTNLTYKFSIHQQPQFKSARSAAHCMASCIVDTPRPHARTSTAGARSAARPADELHCCDSAL